MPRPHFTSPFGRRQTPTTPTTTTDHGESCPACGRSYDSGKRRPTTYGCGHVCCRACARDRKRTCRQCTVIVGDSTQCRLIDMPGTVSLHVHRVHRNKCLVFMSVATRNLDAKIAYYSPSVLMHVCYLVSIHV